MLSTWPSHTARRCTLTPSSQTPRQRRRRRRGRGKLGSGMVERAEEVRWWTYRVGSSSLLQRGWTTCRPRARLHWLTWRGSCSCPAPTSLRAWSPMATVRETCTGHDPAEHELLHSVVAKHTLVIITLWCTMTC